MKNSTMKIVELRTGATVPEVSVKAVMAALEDLRETNLDAFCDFVDICRSSQETHKIPAINGDILLERGLLTLIPEGRYCYAPETVKAITVASVTGGAVCNIESPLKKPKKSR